MQGNQYSVKVYETIVEDEARFMDFFDANYTLFKDHLIVIQGVLSEEIKQYLEKKLFSYMHNVQLPKGRTRKAVDKTLEAEKSELVMNQQMIEFEISRLSDRLQNNLTVLDSMIRSGQEIKIEGDLLLLNRVNSGATINVLGNLIITQVIEGAIRCNGNFMILAASPKANIVFHGIEVKNDLLENKLNRVELKNHRIVITPVLKKEISWV